MQETRDASGYIRQRVFEGKDLEEIQKAMDNDIQAGEVVVRRKELTPVEYWGVNRHERRKAAKLSRKKR